MRKLKHIKITEDTWRLLNESGKKGETYDQIIRRKLRKSHLRV